MGDQLHVSTLLEIIQAAASEVFSTMLGIDIQRRPSGGQVETPPEVQVFSFIGLTGAYTGNGYLLCSAATGCDIASKFLMTEFAAINDEVLDAIGEATNMIVGSIKNDLERNGVMYMSVPTVIYGSNISTHQVRSNVNVHVEFVYPSGEFSINLALLVPSGGGVSLGANQRSAPDPAPTTVRDRPAGSAMPVCFSNVLVALADLGWRISGGNSLDDRSSDAMQHGWSKRQLGLSWGIIS